jgi:surface carbohydrate biosynthesis protein
MGAATTRVCLIVDNPLRDLDGLVLIAWHLARQGVDTYLVPMYEQVFDVLAIEPDLVLANYARPNNMDALKLYRSSGILVGVLDTEGAAGKSADDYAQMVARMNCAEHLDFYCIWGHQQYQAFVRHSVMPKDLLFLTGCPRYDYCSPPWQEELPVPVGVKDYVLINTNFPIANPRFSHGTRHEGLAMQWRGSDSAGRM